jgi:hypothetical protein
VRVLGGGSGRVWIGSAGVLCVGLRRMMWGLGG